MSTFKEFSQGKSASDNKFYLQISSMPVSVSVILTIGILFFIGNLPAKMPLFYSLPWGTDQLASHFQFLILPAVIVLITLINLSLSWYLHQSQTFLKQALLYTSLVVTLILLVTFIKIVTIFI